MSDIYFFGVGISATLATTSAERNTFVGTYTPERISGSKYSFLSDIWSLGVVFLECATGRFPYAAPEGEEWGYFELMDAIVNQPPAFASPAHFSPELCLFISACLQKDPKNRLSANGLMLGTLVQRNSGPISRFYERRHNFHCCLLNLSQHSSLAIDDILWFLNRGLSEEIK